MIANKSNQNNQNNNSGSVVFCNLTICEQLKLEKEQRVDKNRLYTADRSSAHDLTVGP